LGQKKVGGTKAVGRLERPFPTCKKGKILGARTPWPEGWGFQYRRVGGFGKRGWFWQFERMRKVTPNIKKQRKQALPKRNGEKEFV